MSELEEMSELDERIAARALAQRQRNRREKIRSLAMDIGARRIKDGEPYNMITAESDVKSVARMFDMVNFIEIKDKV